MLADSILAQSQPCNATPAFRLFVSSNGGIVCVVELRRLSVVVWPIPKLIHPNFGDCRFFLPSTIFSSQSAMKIAELEAHYDDCADSERTIRAMVENGELSKVFSVCTASFPHIDPAIKFRKKRGITPEIPDFLAFTTILKYAPPLFEHVAIESLMDFVNSTRVLLKSEMNFLHSIEVARKREQLAHRLWNHLERHPGMLQRDIRTELGVVQEDAVNIVKLWEQLGILDRQSEDRSYRLYFRTRLDTEVAGLCPNCGVRGKGRKELFFRSVACQECGTEGHYHIEYGGSM